MVHSPRAMLQGYQCSKFVIILLRFLVPWWLNCASVESLGFKNKIAFLSQSCPHKTEENIIQVWISFQNNMPLYSKQHPTTVSVKNVCRYLQEPDSRIVDISCKVNQVTSFQLTTVMLGPRMFPMSQSIEIYCQ